jgi:hypothetical protein
VANPVMNAGADVVLNYSSISGGPTSQVLSGSAVVTAPGTAITTWLWELLEKPDTSAASLSSTSAQNPVLNNIDLPGTYRLFLRGTDDAAQSSEADKLRAPSSAFVQISVRTQHAGLQKPAPTQRDWHDEYWEVVDELDDLRGDHNTHISDFTDPHNTLSNDGSVAVTNAPSGSGQILRSTSATQAAWTSSSGAAATTADLGNVKLTEAPFDALNPKAVVKDKITWTAKVSGTLKSGGFTPFQIDIPAAQIGTSGTPSPYCVVFRMPYNVYLTEATFIFEDGGSGAGQYDITVRDLTGINYINNAGGANLGTFVIPPNSGEPTYFVGTLNASVFAGQYIGVAVTRAPATPGGGLTVQIDGYQVF